MSEIKLENSKLFQSIAKLENAESALELAWEELEKKTAETIAELTKSGAANTQEIGERFAAAKQLRSSLKTEMRQAVSRLEFHLENSPMAVVEWDSEFRVLRWSPEAEKIFGWKTAEIIGKGWHELSLIYEPDCEAVYSLANKLLDGSETRTFGYNRNYTKDGSVIYCEWYNSALRDTEGKLVSLLSFARDVTDRHRIQEELHQREQAFSAIAENSTDIITRFDRELRLLYVNKAIESATRKTPAELIGNSTQQLGMPSHLCELWDETFLKVFCTGKPETIEFEFPSIEGIKHYHCRVIPEFAADNSVATVLSISRDITEIKQVESQLRQSEAKFRCVVNSNIIGIFFWNIDGRITDANDAFLNTVNYTREELLSGRISWSQITPPEYRNQDEKTLAELKATGVVTPTEKQYIRSDGSRVTVLLGGDFLEDSQQLGVSFVLDLTARKQAELELQKQQRILESIVQTIPNLFHIIEHKIGTSRDITELVETKQALSERTEQLEAVNKELESFSYSVSHDLRAPLRHISGFVNALKQRLEASEALTDRKIVHYIEVIEDSSQKMSLLIDGLLALSRVCRTDCIQIPIDLTRLVQTAIKLAKLQLVTNSVQTPQAVEFEIGDLPTVMGDPTLLQQVFSNLIDNAVKFSRDRTPARIMIDSLPDGTLFVKDNGVGFEMEYADRLFGVFQRLHSQKEFEGTGIGLAIAWRIIQRHGGKIWGESIPGQGATFYFKLGFETIPTGHAEL